MGLISRVSSRTYREQDEVSYSNHKRAIYDASTDHGSCPSDRTRQQKIRPRSTNPLQKPRGSPNRSPVRSVPYIMTTFKVAKLTEAQIYSVLREEFSKHGNVTDPRVVDMLVIKGKIELQEQVELWQQRTHFYRRFQETTKKAPDSFMGKFLTQKNF